MSSLCFDLMKLLEQCPLRGSCFSFRTSYSYAYRRIYSLVASTFCKTFWNLTYFPMLTQGNVTTMKTLQNYFIFDLLKMTVKDELILWYFLSFRNNYLWTFKKCLLLWCPLPLKSSKILSNFPGWIWLKR